MPLRENGSFLFYFDLRRYVDSATASPCGKGASGALKHRDGYREEARYGKLFVVRILASLTM